jgi:hypothetical protein
MTRPLLESESFHQYLYHRSPEWLWGDHPIYGRWLHPGIPGPAAPLATPLDRDGSPPPTVAGASGGRAYAPSRSGVWIQTCVILVCTLCDVHRQMHWRHKLSRSAQSPGIPGAGRHPRAAAHPAAPCFGTLLKRRRWRRPFRISTWTADGTDPMLRPNRQTGGRFTALPSGRAQGASRMRVLNMQ